MSTDPWEWSVDDVVHELCHPEGQLRAQNPRLTFNPEDLAASLRNNEIDGETFLVVLTKETLKEDLGIPSLGLRFKIWRVVEDARAKSAKFDAFRRENSDQFIGSFNKAPTTQSLKREPTSPSIGQVTLARTVDSLVAPLTSTNNGAVPQDDAVAETLANVKAHRGEHVFIEESGRKRRKLTLAAKVGVYLDDHAMPVDSVFFGATPVGAEVDLGIKGRDDEIQREADHSWSQVDTNSTLVHFQHAAPPRSGQSRYVGRLMQRYLLRSNAKKPRYFKHDDAVAVGLQPSAIAKSTKNPSMPKASLSVILNDPEGPVAYRVRAQDWEYDGSYTNGKHKMSFPARRKLLQTSTALEDWSFLDKYVEDNDADEIAPLYGESGSEGSYDTETWNEIEEERLAKTTEKRGNYLSLDQVKAILEEEKAAMRETWVTKKLPMLQNRAWKIWSRSRFANTFSADVQSAQKETARLLTRLRKFEENICEMSWTKASEVKAQCQSLQPTVVDVSAAEWKLNLLQQSDAPPMEPVATEQRARIRAQPSDLDDDEEELTDSEYDDNFVVQDEHDASTTMPISHDQRGEPPAEDVRMTSEPAAESNLDGTHIAEHSEDQGNLPEHTHDSILSLHESLEVLPNHSQSVEQAKSLPKFRMPREVHSMLPQEPVEVISLSSSEMDTNASRGTSTRSGSVLEEEPEILSMSLKQLRRVDWVKVSSTGDGKAMLAWLMTRQARLFDPVLRLLDFQPTELLDFVYDGYKSLLDLQYKKIHALPPDLSIDPQPVFTLGLWFIPWSKNVAWFKDLDMSMEGIHKPLLAQMVAAWPPTNIGWQEFLTFVKERILWTRNRTSKPSVSVKERGKSTRAHFNSYKAQAPGQSQRDSARERQLAAQMRREQLQKLLEHSPLSEATLDAIVNLDKTTSDECVRINEHIARRMKPHQLEGVQFMWTEIIASAANEGCLLAQPMGMGKTMQVIAFLLTVAETAKNTNPAIYEQIPKHLRPAYSMILAPPSLVENWYDELLKWLPSNYSETIGEIHKLTSALTVPERVGVVKEWNQQGGVLLLPTSFFRAAMLEQFSEGRTLLYGDITDMLRTLPRIVVIDEAHELKNSASKLSAAVRQVETKARIAMTGSPLANNLGEYFNLVDFVAEGYLGTPQDFRARYINPITEGQYVEASKQVQRRALKMQKVLTQDLAPKIHRAEVTQLHQQLHGKTEFIIRVQLTDLQLECYRRYVESISQRETDSIPLARLWAFLSILKLLCNHPKCFHDKLTSGGVENSAQASITDQTENLVHFEQTDQESQALAQDPAAILEDGMLRRQIQLLRQPECLDSPSLSNKMVILFQIVNLCVQSHEKLLIFSHSIPTLNFVESYLRELRVRLIRIDGSTKAELRQDQTKRFNEGNDQVALISTRAGGVGLNLFGASRVVIMDDWFNPILEQQAIGRAYRIGQTRHVYVYRLLAAGSFEEELQNQGYLKLGLANRIVDKKDTIRTASKISQTWLRQPIVTQCEDLSEVRHRDGKVLEPILRDESLADCVHSIKLGDSFLTEEKEELTAEEQLEAAQLIKEEHLRRTDPQAYERWRISHQAALIRESVNAVTGVNGGNNQVPSSVHPVSNPSNPPAPTQVSAPSALDSGLGAPTKPQMASDRQTTHEHPATTAPPITPQRPVEHEVIDLTLSGSAPRVGDVQSDGSNDGQSRTKIGSMTLRTSEKVNAQPKQEPDSPKKSRKLILPDSGKPQRVGTFGVDASVIPKPSSLLIAPDASALQNQVPVDYVNEAARNKARNRLGDHVFQRLDPKTTADDQDMPKMELERLRTFRRRQAVVKEREIFKRSKSYGQYYQLMENAARNWAPDHRELNGGQRSGRTNTPPQQQAKRATYNQTQKQSTGTGRIHPPAQDNTRPAAHSPTRGKPGSPARGNYHTGFMGAHLTTHAGPSKPRRSSGEGRRPTDWASGSNRSPILEKHFGESSRRQSMENPRSTQPLRQHSDSRQPPSPRPDRRDSADQQSLRIHGSGSAHQARQWLDAHFSPTQESQHPKTLTPQQQSRPQALQSPGNGRSSAIRDHYRKQIFNACLQAYKDIRKQIKKMPSDAVIKRLADQIEADANREETDAMYVNRLTPPPWRAMLVHLQNFAPDCV